MRLLFLLADDATALQDRINPNAPMVGVDIAKIYRESGGAGKATEFVPLANCGKKPSRLLPINAVEEQPRARFSGFYWGTPFCHRHTR
jgi:hypothetical protein